MNILFLTEDTSFRLSLRKYLAEENHNIFLAKDVKEGMLFIKTEKVDLVISDLNMKFTDGIDFCKKVREMLKEKELPFIFVTIYDDESSKLKIETLKNCKLIRKGISPGEIVNVIHDLASQVKSGKSVFTELSEPHQTNVNTAQVDKKKVDTDYFDAQLLVVDDDDNLRMLLIDTLKDQGYTNITEAVDGSEAITLLQSRSFHLILLDIIMPNVSGFGVLKYVHENMPQVKVIMLTAYADMKLAVEAKNLGAADFIAKPFMRDDLLNTIKQVLSQ